MELATDRATLTASRLEFERLKTLHAQDQNVSLRALQTAEATAQHDQLALEAAQQRLFLTWGKAIADQTNLADFVQSLSKVEAVLVRVDLPSGEKLSVTPVSARLVVAQNEYYPVEAAFLSTAMAVDPQTQGQGFYFLVQPNVARLVPGAAVTAYLPVPGPAEVGVVVPRAAVVRYEGKAWVYVQSAEDSFVRRKITLDRALAQGWFTKTGLDSNDRVVVTDASVLLSEELNSSTAFRTQRD
jgi:hypothetical protein